MAAQPLKVLVWNVRGLNSPARRNAIRQVVQTVNPAVVCLQETKLELVTVDIVRHFLGNRFENFYYMPADGTRGGIAIAWDEMLVSLSNPHTTQNTLTTLVNAGEAQAWCLTCVYGP